MQETETFIKLYRKIMEWEWYTDVNTKSVFIHCLLRANWKDTKWRGINIKRGQFITSNQSLAREVGLTVQNVRTAIKRLLLTRELTRSATAKYTVLTVVNYNSYHPANKVANKQLTSNQQTTNKQLTTDKNNNNNKNNKNISKDITKVDPKNKAIQSRNIELIEYFKEKLGTDLDGTGNWRYCTHLYNKLKRNYPDKNTIEGVKLLIDTALQDEFHSQNTTGFKYLFNNMQKIIRQAKANNERNLIIKI